MNAASTTTAAQLEIIQSTQAESEKAQRDFSAAKAILSKAAAEFAQGPGNDYAKSRQKLSDLSAKIDQARDNIKALTERYSELMDASGGDVTPPIREVQRSRTETRETLDTLTEMLTTERLRVRKLWIQAIEPAQDLRHQAEKQRTQWKEAKVSSALAEALPTLSPGLALALILDPDKTTKTLKAWAEEMQAAGLLPQHSEKLETIAPDLMDMDTMRIYGGEPGANTKGVVSPILFHRLKEMVSMEGDERHADKVRHMRHHIEQSKGLEALTIPGGTNPDDAEAWHTV